MTIHIATPEQLPQAARQFIDSLGSRRVVAFHAPMGAGKTTLISAIARLLGIEEPATSPTFAIVNEYHVNDNDKSSPSVGNWEGAIYHLDLYRLRSLGEAVDIGLEDYLYSGAYCFIEWPDIAEPLLPEDTCHVYITVNPDGSRDVEL